MEKYNQYGGPNMNGPWTGYFAQTLEDIRLDESFVLDIKMDFDVSKCNLDIWTVQDLFCNDTINYQNKEAYENVLSKERYRRICSLGIYHLENVRKRSLNESELLNMRLVLLMMTNLTTLTFHFMCIGSGSRFKYFFRGIVAKIKNVKIYDCQEMTLEDLIELAERFPSIENLFLDNVLCMEITTTTIISLFKNLQSLQITFCSDIWFQNIFDHLTRWDEINGYRVLDWPPITFLSIICIEPNIRMQEFLSGIENRTPRKPGRFLLDNPMYKDRPSLRIIIQKNSNYYAYLNDLFETLGVPYITHRSSY